MQLVSRESANPGAFLQLTQAHDVQSKLWGIAMERWVGLYAWLLDWQLHDTPN